MGTALRIEEHHDAAELRALAGRENNSRAASRMVAIANALDGMSRMAAARSAGMDRQTLHNWVIRYNAKGVSGLYDQPKGHMPKKLTESEQVALLAAIFRARSGARWGTLASLCDWTEARFGKRLSAAGQ